MNASAISIHRNSIKKLVSGFVCAIAIATTICVYLYGGTVFPVASVEHNAIDLPAELLFGAGVFMAFCFSCVSSSDGLRQIWNFRLAIQHFTNGYIGRKASYWILQAVVSAAVLAATATMPSRASPDEGYVLVSALGVVFPGETLALNRFSPAEAVAVPVVRDFSTDYGFKRSSIYTAHALISYRIVLAQNAAVRQFLRKNAHNLQIGSLVDEGPLSSYGYLVRTAAGAFLGPKINEVLREVEVHQISGSKASMLLRLGQLVDADRANMPGWIGSLQISDIDTNLQFQD